MHLVKQMVCQVNSPFMTVRANQLKWLKSKLKPTPQWTTMMKSQECHRDQTYQPILNGMNPRWKSKLSQSKLRAQPSSWSWHQMSKNLLCTMNLMWCLKNPSKILMIPPHQIQGEWWITTTALAYTSEKTGQEAWTHHAGQGTLEYNHCGPRRC